MSIDKDRMPKHIAIIMDGNRRWAKEKGLDTKLGHKAGAERLEKIAEYANEIGLEYLTVYAFSTENWKRAESEVGALMLLLKAYVDKFFKKANKNNIRINLLGNLNRVDKSISKKIEEIMEATKDNTGLTLNIAFNYGGRDEITRAVREISQKITNDEIKIEEIDEKLISKFLYTKEQPDPDILIRPGGEQRLSNFLPWQLTYSEFLFIEKYWPDFGNEDLLDVIEDYQKRNRRFGGE